MICLVSVAILACIVASMYDCGCRSLALASCAFSCLQVYSCRFLSCLQGFFASRVCFLFAFRWVASLSGVPQRLQPDGCVWMPAVQQMSKGVCCMRSAGDDTWTAMAANLGLTDEQRGLVAMLAVQLEAMTARLHRECASLKVMRCSCFSGPGWMDGWMVTMSYF